VVVLTTKANYGPDSVTPTGLGPRMRTAAAILALQLFCCCARAADYEFSKEAESFEQHKEDPASLLERMYNESQILFLGAANHHNFTHHDYLMALLKKVGTDPKLRFIVLEQFHDNDPFYSRLSSEPIEQVVKDYPFGNPHERAVTLCWSREWSYVYMHDFAIVQEINRHRPSDAPLIVHAEDGFPLWFSPVAPSVVPVKPGSCTYGNPQITGAWVNSNTRERATAENFDHDIWSSLKPGEKAIVLYHQSHLYRGFEKCGADIGDAEAVTNIAPSSWLDFFLLRRPEALSKIKLVIFDEVDDAHHSDGVLRFSKRQSFRHPGESWGFDMRHLRGLELERGEDAWLFSQVFHLNSEGMFHSDRYFYDMFDAVVYTPNARQMYELKQLTADYLPGICTGKNYDGISLLLSKELKGQ
jgi:hypothetical protein